MSFSDFIHDNFTLKNNDNHKKTVFESLSPDELIEGLAVLRAVDEMMHDERLTGGIEDYEFSNAEYGAMIASLYTVLRSGDEDWKALDSDTAHRLHLGVAFVLLQIPKILMKHRDNGGDDDEED